MQEPHIRLALDAEPDAVRAPVMKLGGPVETALVEAAEALDCREPAQAEQVCAGDDAIDALEAAIQVHCARILALRAPAAGDLRLILSGMRIASMLERASDCARNLAKRTPMARAMRSGRPKCAMMEDPRTITACMHLHFIARNIARVGDHATAIAEQVPGDPRPKMDSATGDAV